MGQTAAADIATIGRISAVPAILQVIRELTGLRFAAVARVTEHSWTACAVLDQLDFGLQVGGELDVVTTLCHEIHSAHGAVVIDKASEDPLYRDHHTPRLYKFESYISVPVFRTDGSFFGTICALDPEPALLKSSKIQSTMASFARMLALQIEAEENHQQTEAALHQERHTCELREQFIAVLGHDLRNPLFAISAAAEMLQRKFSNPASDRLVNHILTSSQRAAQLVDDVLDFARGRLGNGIPVNIQACQDLDDALKHIVSEIQSLYPQRVIRSSISPLRGIHCDRARVAQLLSNLLANAMVHGDTDGEVEITALADQGTLMLAVRNQGEIPEQVLPHLFQPYTRHNRDAPQAGLGLGLYIASQIAQSHGGRLHVASTAQHGTLFTFSLPSTI
ncbi:MULTISPECIES: GAF domain-containing sensor histidine kinase [unclassified Pseudomonas]|uniref:GAF domain-containing sensor histidine kinase n=1 Tax=unclassified Pseudomonas TaxID=196821 RepID=UPI002AC98E02|nr:MULTISPECIES: GAF domain-containing sensor histidine kinase [unclassified Pseudomonas]MEB0047870.1 GAF domain-containing sensor histidine kinase [Pseudomonas sp. Dout3]MEB0098979.1 GAF domain-containing sensor histidine kinase [Pseudomonas sp. DC1.2]WPX57618.1 GAF domain-containing sensor histidine kinase [Pseudomonas sp. DC1.2]